MKIEYTIIPVDFKDYTEYLNKLNKHGQDGWVFNILLREYMDSPAKGYVRHEYLCMRYESVIGNRNVKS